MEVAVSAPPGSGQGEGPPGLRLGSHAGFSDVSRSFEPNSGPACAQGRLRHAVLCEAREEPFERLLPDLVVDL